MEKKKIAVVGLVALAILILSYCVFELLATLSYRAGQESVLDVVRKRQEICQEVNLVLQRQQVVSRDCTAYGEIVQAVRDAD